MKTAAITLAALLMAAPAFADDGAVSHSTLAALGIADLAPMTEAQGTQIRGTNVAMAGAVAAVSGVLFDPNTKSFVNFGEADFAMTNADAMNAAASAAVGFNFGITLQTIDGFSASASGAKLGFGFGGVNDSAFRVPAFLLTPAP